MHAVIYTAIFGGSDDLKQPTPQNESCDFICFADEDCRADAGIWRVSRTVPDLELGPRKQARRIKLLSHQVLSGGHPASQFQPLSLRRPADLSIWIDGSIRIKSPNFVRDMRAVLGEDDWAMFVHPDRDCIYSEALICSGLKKCHGMPVLEQVETYRSIVPPHAGLYASGIIVRREPASARMRSVYELWWEEILRWTSRDQLSLPYVLRKVGSCETVQIPGALRSSDWFDIVPHNITT